MKGNPILGFRRFVFLDIFTFRFA